MSRIDPQQGLMPSLLDRLIDQDSAGTSWRRGYGIEQMVDAVRRDLEELLNTRQSHMGLSPEYVELNNSIIAYGLPDLTSLNAITARDREEIGRKIEAIVSRFEPRLRDVKESLLNTDSKDRSVRFRVDARLCVEPAPEVAFDTVLQISTGQYTITPSNK